MRTFIAVVFIGFAVALSCGKSELNYTGMPPGDQKTLELVPSPQTTTTAVPTKEVVREGALVMDSNSIAKSGIVSYTIFRDGSIDYTGTITFLGRDNGQADSWVLARTWRYILSESGAEISTQFRGHYQASDKTVMSSSYRDKGNTLEDGEVRFEVAESERNLRTIAASFQEALRKPYSDHGSPTDHNAKGTIVIDVSGDIVDVVAGEIQGRVFNMDLVLHFKKFQDKAR